MGKYLVLALCLFNLPVLAQVFDVPHADQTATRTLLVEAPKSRAVVLLFPGGGGLLRLHEGGSTRNKHTFVRSLDLWSQYQINAVLVDTPYDLGDVRRGDLRGQADHLQRVNEVLNFYQEKLHLPIWIFGHSMGTSTATHFANSINPSSKALSGIIIAGTIKTASLDEGVVLPVLAIHHAQDSCPSSLPENAPRIVNERSKKLISELEIIDGGISEGNICDSFAYHGFNQIESELVKRAAQFILSH